MKKVAELDSVVPDKNILVATQNLDADQTMPVDLQSDDEEEEQGEKPMDANTSAAASAKKSNNKKKTKAQRNRELRQRKIEEEFARQKEQRRLESEVLRLKKLQKNMFQTDQDRLLEERRQRREQARLQRPGRLSKHAFRELPTEVKLSDELTDTLRELKPEGSVFKDRFNSLQKRSLIEPRVRVTQRRRYQQKEFEKHSYKAFK